MPWDSAAALAAAHGVLSRAAFQLHVDINVGDPIWPDAEQTRLPRLLEGDLRVRGYSLELVLAGKVVTAVARGSANTRWRDFVDIHELARPEFYNPSGRFYF
jgi:hypothetical protein